MIENSDSWRDLMTLYLLSLLGMMSGLAGHDRDLVTGSAFMTESNGRPVAFSLEALQHIQEADPRAIYWDYITARAKLVKMPLATIEDLALARLMCLTRVTIESDKHTVIDAWKNLAPGDKDTLIQALVSDGIEENACVYMFLPMCLERAKSNPAVGLENMLKFMAELVDQVAWQVGSHKGKDKIETVDLSDLAAWVFAVKSTSVFCTGLDQAKLRVKKSREGISLAMTDANWRLIDEIGEGRELSVKQILRKVLQSQEVMNGKLSAPRPTEQSNVEFPFECIDV